MEIASSAAYTVLVTNRLATRCTFAMTRRPSARMWGTTPNSPSSSTSRPTARVAGLPVPIAMPMSAALSAGMSLTPSPVIATTWPRDWSASTASRF